MEAKVMTSRCNCGGCVWCDLQRVTAERDALQADVDRARAAAAKVRLAAMGLLSQTINSNGPHGYICIVCERVSPWGEDHAEECEVDALVTALATEPAKETP